MEKIKQFAFIITMGFIVVSSALIQNTYTDWRARGQIEQSELLQTKYDEGYTEGRNTGLAEQLTDDDKVRVGQMSVINNIIQTLKDGRDFKINTPDGEFVLIEKPVEESNE